MVEMVEGAGIGCKLTRVTITSGDEVASLPVKLEERKLRVAGGMAEAATLVREMQGMRVKITPSGREQYAARGKDEHDDLVMALALAAWWLKRKNLAGRGAGAAEEMRGVGGGKSQRVRLTELQRGLTTGG